MREPSLRTSRLLIAGAAVAAIVIATAGFLVGRAGSPQPSPAVEMLPEPTVAASLPPEQPRILERGDLIALAGRVADASASQQALPGDVAELVGRRVELAIPFGCEGPMPQEVDASLSWRYDAERQTLRIRVSPMTWSTTDWGLAPPSAVAPSAAGPSAEGFWIARPWSSFESCPEKPGDAALPATHPATGPDETLAVAQFRGVDGSGRPPRSFDVVKRFAPEDLESSHGFRLKLVGRLDKLPDGWPVRCIQPKGREHRPICVLAVAFEELRIENPASGDVLGVWSIGRASPAD